MINISNKDIVTRFSKASGSIVLKESTISMIKEGRIKKGNVEEAARIAGILGAKETWMRLPYCHQVPLESVDFSFKVTEREVKVTCTVSANWKTGVEMDALSCVSSALLTVWDMVKYLEKDESGNYPETKIRDILVEEKIKGGPRSQD